MAATSLLWGSIALASSFHSSSLAHARRPSGVLPSPRTTVPGVFDVVVVGGGMIGASASRHLAESGLEVAVVAPPEPADPAGHNGPFGAHYDEARLSRSLYAGEVEAELSRRARDAVAYVEEHSERPVYTGSGHLYVSLPGDDDGIASAVEALPEGHGVEVLGGDDLGWRFPEMAFQDDMVGYLEPGAGGALNPRGLVAAQLRGAVAAGAEVVGSPAVAVEDDADRRVTLADGTVLAAGKVLLATGAFTGTPGLLERRLALRIKTETVLFAELGGPEADRLAGIPPFHYSVVDGSVADVYVAPPTTYPDGSVLLKWGANTVADRWLGSVAEVRSWYRGGDSDGAITMMRPSMEATFPGLRPMAWHSHRCAITYTNHALPYIDALVPGSTYLAVGGNGRSAKWAEPLGALAASLVAEDRWTDELPAERFAARFEDEGPDWSHRTLLSEWHPQPAPRTGADDRPSREAAGQDPSEWPSGEVASTALAAARRAKGMRAGEHDR